MKLDPREFRNALGCFATGITVITAVGADGELTGNTVSSFNSVSLDPPLILWSLAKTSFSLQTYLDCDHFAVNVLRQGQHEVSSQFASARGLKWQAIDYDTWDTGCPILPSALAVFECKTAHTYMGGDHVIFIGEVINADYDPGGAPLMFFRGRYQHIEDQIS